MSARECGMGSKVHYRHTTRSHREVAGEVIGLAGGWYPICRACYRELRAAYASGAQGPRYAWYCPAHGRGGGVLCAIGCTVTGGRKVPSTLAERMAALREVTR